MKVMNIFKHIYSLLAVALVGLSLAACSEDNLDTNQYKGGVSLNAYGPNPVMRGGVLRFVGSNLDQVASVQIPGVSPITNYEVIKAGVPSEIRVTVPKDGPEVGIVSLTTKDNQTLVTQSELTYTEPIEFEGFSPASVMPGDVVTIKGDYLNLIYSLAFADGVIISENDFLTHDRYTITVAVPEDAKTGKIELYTTDLTVQEEEELEYQIIIADEAIEIGLPAVSKLKGRNEVDALGTITAKAGESISITGTYFNMADDVTIGGVSAADLKIANDGTGITFTLPETAPDGDIEIVCKSGVEVPVGKLTTVKPSECVATPKPVKAGSELRIDGKDMDLVTDVEFADAQGEYTITGNANIIKTKEAYAVTVPETAVEGNLRLVMANGSRIEVPFTLVKPTATGYDKTTVSAGGTLTIKGTDLDLVKSVLFGEGSDLVEVKDATAESITLTVPMNAVSGAPVLTLANGTTVGSVPEINIDEAVFCYITAMPDFNDDNTPSAGDTFTVPVKNADKLTNVYVNGKEVRYVYSEKNSMLTLGIPQDAKAESTLKLVSSNGEIEYTISVIPAGSITQVIFEGPFELTWSTSTQGMIPASVFDNIPEDASVSIVFNYTATGSNPIMKVNNGSWGHVILETGLAPAQETLYSFDPNGNELAVSMTTAAINNLKASSTDWGGILIIHGSDAIINKISLQIEISQEKDLAGVVSNMNGTAITYPYTFTWDDTGRFSLSQDQLKALGVKKGSKMMFYKDTSVTGQIQINNSSWSAIYTLADWSAEKDVLVQEFDDALMEAVNGGGLVLQGDISGITKMTILP